MFILGAGMAGCLAGIMNGGAAIFEAAPSLPENHHGVLRFRTDNISRITGIPFKKVKVFKSIWCDGKEQPLSPRMNNLYSQKVVGKIQERSILNIEPAIRYIAPERFHQQLGFMMADRIKFSHKVESISDQTISFTTGSYNYQYKDKYERPIISTIPLPALLEVLGECVHSLTKDVVPKSVFVARLEIPGANVHQTIYFPHPELGIYRASMVGSTLIIESMNPLDGADELFDVEKAFGMSLFHCRKSLHWIEQKGKFSPIADSERKSCLLNLSTKHNVWSLGRYACWRPSILMDDVYDDILKIRSMMGAHHYDVRRLL